MTAIRPLAAIALGTSMLMTTASAGAVDWSQELGDHAGKTLRIIMIQDPWVDQFATINPEFEELTGAKVEIESFGYDQTHEKEVLEGASGSSQYDIIVLDSPWVGEFAEAGFVEDLQPYIDDTDPEVIAWDDFMPAFQEVADWNGTIVGVPFGAYVQMLHYRTDLFEQAGLEPPKTFAEWQKAAEFFTDNPDFPGVYGTAMNNQRGAAIGQQWFEFIWGYGGRPFESNYPGSEDQYADLTPRFDSAESKAVLQTFKDMLKYQPPGAESFAWDERATTFSSGKTAVILAWSVRTPLFKDPNRSQVADKFATAVYPAKEGSDPVPPLGGWVMGINSNAAQKDLAWDYIKWFTSPEIHKKFVIAGGPPSRLSTMEDPEVKAAVPWVETVYESQKYVFADCRPRIPESFQIIDTVGLYASQAVQGQITVDEATAKMTNDIRQLLVSSGYKVGE